MEVLCRLSYSSTQPMIATRPTLLARRAASALLTAVLLAARGGRRPRPRTRRRSADRVPGPTGARFARAPSAWPGPPRSGPGGTGVERPRRRGRCSRSTPPPVALLDEGHAAPALDRVVGSERPGPRYPRRGALRDPCAPCRPGAASVGAAGMRQGWFAEHGVEVGDVVEVRFP